MSWGAGGRFGLRQDKVHKPIVDELEARGIIVYNMPDPGDVLCYGFDDQTKAYQWVPMEFKSSNAIRKKKKGLEGELTPRQAKMREKRSKAPIPIVYTIEEALALFGRAL